MEKNGLEVKNKTETSGARPCESCIRKVQPKWITYLEREMEVQRPDNVLLLTSSESQVGVENRKLNLPNENHVS